LASAKTDQVQMSATPLPTPRPQLPAKKAQASKTAAAAKLRVRRAQPTAATGRAAAIGSPTLSASALPQPREIGRGWGNAN
jgi:hypothetical protein